MRQWSEQPDLTQARSAIAEIAPELCGAPLSISMLDGPPGSPRFAVMAETCRVQLCPHGVSAETAKSGKCPVVDCPLRCSVRILLQRDGTVQLALRNGIHWLSCNDELHTCW